MHLSALPFPNTDQYETSNHLLSYHFRRLEASSLHHQSIRALHTQHGDPFSHSVRLLSLWLSKHYFSGFFSHKQIELLAASVFLDPKSLQAPTTSASALFRILDTLGKHDFDVSPLVVIFESDLNKGKISKQAADAFKIFQTTSEHTRSSLLTLSSNDLMREDFGDSLNADSAVEKVSLRLIQKCAAESALNLVARALQNDNTSLHPIDENIFHDSVLLDEQCNLVLQFNASIQCKGDRGHLSGPKFASLKVYSNTVHAFCNPSRLVIGDASSSSANIIQEEIVMSLRKQFRDVAIFFWDETEGDRLGVILKPSAFLTSNFASTNSRRRMPITDGSKAHLPMISDVSQIAMNIFASGNGCFSDIVFR